MFQNKTQQAKFLIFTLLVAAFVGVTVFVGASHTFNSSKGQPTAKAAKPEVLGASIYLRGPQLPIVHPSLATPIDDSLISAQSYLVVDVATSDIIAQKNPDQKQSIASLTKLLTALVVYNNTDLATRVTIRPEDKIDIAPILNLKVGDSISIQDLFNAMLVGSNNDSALALANHTADLVGKKFIDLMNQQASALGMDSSHFSNPLGFESSENYSTARDVLKLAQATQKYAAFTSLSEKTEYEFTSFLGVHYATKATNKLIGKYPQIFAIKTGYTEAAGQTMVTKATDSGHAIVIVVLGSLNRDSDTLELQKQVFANARWQ